MESVPDKPKTGPRPATRRLLAAAVLAGLSAGPAAAANFNWTGQAQDNDWFNPFNWQNDFGQPQLPTGGANDFALILNGQTVVIDPMTPGAQVGDLEGIIVGGDDVAPSKLEHLAGTTQPVGGFQGFMRIGPSGNYGTYAMEGTAVQNKPLFEIGTAPSDSAPGGHGILTMQDIARFEGDQFAIGFRGNAQDRSFGDVALVDKAEFHTTGWVRFENGVMSMSDDTLGLIGGDFYVGNRAGGDAKLDMNRNSVIEVSGDLQVGRSGADGQINLSGNARLSHLAQDGQSIRLGAVGSGDGTISISENAVLESLGNMVLGEDQGINGNFVQTGGSVILKDNPDAPSGFTDSLEIRGGLISNSTYKLDGGLLRVETLDARAGGFIFTGGRLAITERFRGALVQDGGTMAAGNSPGEVTYESDYTLNGNATLEVEIQGTDNSDFDRYLVVGDVNLNNGPTLEVILLDNFNPMPGNSFDFMDWGGAINGVFGTFNLPALDAGVKWLLDNVHTDGEIRVGWAADLDGDGDVDDADYGLLFASYTGPDNGPPGNPDADLDQDGDVDDADYALAFATFTGPGGAATVPEPASIALLLTGAALGMRRRRNV